MADTEIFEGQKAKPKKRTRAPLSEAQKQVLRDRLKKAREAKKEKKTEPKEPKPKKQSKPKKEPVAMATEEVFDKETKKLLMFICKDFFSIIFLISPQSEFC